MACHKVNARVKMDEGRQICKFGHHTVDSGVQGNKEVRTGLEIVFTTGDQTEGKGFEKSTEQRGFCGSPALSLEKGSSQITNYSVDLQFTSVNNQKLQS